MIQSNVYLKHELNCLGVTIGVVPVKQDLRFVSKAKIRKTIAPYAKQPLLRIGTGLLPAPSVPTVRLLPTGRDGKGISKREIAQEMKGTLSSFFPNEKEQNEKSIKFNKKKQSIYQYLLSRMLYTKNDFSLFPVSFPFSAPFPSLPVGSKRTVGTEGLLRIREEGKRTGAKSEKEIGYFFPFRKSFLCYWLLPFLGFTFILNK
jgi:hypothetical protein